MRSRVAVLAAMALGFFMVPAGFAQQQNDSTGSSTKSAAAPAPKPVPPKKASGKSNSMSDAHIKPGTDFPHWELFGGYSYVRYRQLAPGPPLSSDNLHGGSGSIAYNLNHWLGLVADFGEYHAEAAGGGFPVDENMYTYMFGPRFSYRNDSRFTPFAQILFGGSNEGELLNSNGVNENAFAMTAGGGFDVALTKHFSWRVVQTEYLLTTFANPRQAEPQNNLRVSSGFMFRWGAHPEMINRPPTAMCTVDKSSVVAGSGDIVPVHSAASDPDGDSLTYTWSATGGQVDGTGADARWNVGNAGPGSYTITSHVDDGHGGTGSCSADIRVEAPPPPPAPKPPVMSCSADRSTVMAGERANLTATASSPAGYTLTYAWQANAGQIVGTGSSVQFDTTGLAPGSYTITGRADDGHGQAADCTASVTVQQPPPPPQASKINECAFKPAVSPRVDNVCKRVLDDVALRLQNEPKGSVVIIGFANPTKDKRGAKLGTDRAENASKYLVGKGIDKSRITVRSGSGQEGAGAVNQRIDIVWVPEGATY